MTPTHPAVRIAALLVVGGLATASCGARLTPGQRQEALTQGGGGGTGTGAGGDSGTATGTSGSTGSSGTPTGTTGTSGTTSGTTGTSGTSGTTGRSATSGSSGTSGSTGTTGTSGTGSTGTTGNTRSAPPGGNGGATDVGVTKDSITISNVADVSGAVPGLFEDARFAVQAYVKYFTATQGTIYGRKLNLTTYDSQLDAGAARSAAIDACTKSFAGVGSVSAFDQGAADPEKSCGIPDLRGLATTDQVKAVPNVYATNAAGKGGERALGVFGWAKKYYPDAIKKAGYIYIDGDVTRQQQSQDSEAAEKVLGYKFIAHEQVGISETNYVPVVQDLKTKGVQYVTFTGAYQQAANFAKTFASQDYHPQVFQPTVTAYNPNFIQAAGSAAEGVFVAVAPSLIEELNGNPELQTYNTWLQQVKPGATPTGIGEFAWASAALFVKEAQAIGPKLTRKALLAKLAGEHSYTGNGLFAAQDVGGRKLSDCASIVRVSGGKFVRFEPKAPQTVRCGDKVYNTKNGATEAGFPATWAGKPGRA